MTRTRPRGIGLLTADPSRTLVRSVVDARLDFLTIDTEQTGIRAFDCVSIAETLRYTGTRLAIRVPDLSPSTLVEYANTGAAELVLPQLRSAEELRRSHAAVRYEPEGTRSRQPSFASSLGRDFAAPPRLSVLFETTAALGDLSAIVTDPCFEGGWVGPTDLGADLRRSGSALDLESAIDTVIAAVVGAGHPIGLPAASAGGVEAAFARGATECAVYWERHLTAIMSDLAGSAGSSPSERNAS